MKKTYMMGDIAKELAVHKTTVFRSVKELEIEAINENSRKYENSPKKYSEESKQLIIANLIEEEKRTEAQNKALQEHFKTLRNDSETIKIDNTEVVDEEYKGDLGALQEHNGNVSNKIISLLESQLEAKDKELDRAYQEKQDLIRLLDQQQRLSLQANQKIEILELEIKETLEDENEEEKHETKKTKWYDIFKRNKKN
ncbi:MAG: hypothetical protein ACTH0S_04390 [Senegalia sp. (in: firmicutes)]